MKCRSFKISVIIPNWNGKNHLDVCLKALQNQIFDDFEVIVVDNGSDDGSVEWLKSQHPWVRLIVFTKNMGFAAACNAGVKASEAEYIALLNNDTQPLPIWISALVTAMDNARPITACLASKMLKVNQPHLIDDAGDILTWRGGAFKRGHNKQANDFNQREEVMFPCAGAALYRRRILEQVGMFDETFFAYLEDIDLGLRMRLAGYNCLFIPDAVVLHVGHGSAMPHERYIFLFARNRIFLFVKNIPAVLLLKHIHSLIYGWLFYFMAFAFSPMYLRGTAASLKYWSILFKKRKAIQSLTALSYDELDRLLSHEWPEITLGRLTFQWMRHFLFTK